MQETKVGIYTRLSRDDERYGESMSIENQKLMLTDYCRHQEWEIVDVYADDGFTGTNFDRPDMQRMIADAKCGRINTVLVKDLSRFGRNYVEAGQLIEDLFPSLNIRLVAPNDGVDTFRNNNADFIPIRNVFNEYYSKDISRKVLSARRASAKQGKFQGAYAPYGYSFDPEDKHKLVVDEYAAGIVRRIFERRRRGYSYQMIADELNDDGVLNPRDYYYYCKNKPNPRQNEAHMWIEVTVNNILKNEVYIGHMVQFKSGHVSYKNHKIVVKDKSNNVRCENTHEAIIDMETWEIVQGMFRDPRPLEKPRRKSDNSFALFSGMLTCADCGARLDYKQQSCGKGYKPSATYTCHSYKTYGAKACTSHSIQESKLAEIVKADLAAYVSELQLDEDALKDRLIAMKTKEVKAKQDKLKAQRDKAAARLGQLDTLLQRVYEEMLLGVIPRETLLDMSNRYTAEKAEREAEAAELEARIAEYGFAESNAEQWIEKLKEYMNGRDLDNKLLRQLIKEIKVGAVDKGSGGKERSIEINYRF